jgi:hypothetical protein
MGIGTEDSQRLGESIFKLEQFNQRKVYKIATGDFHNLAIASGCNCIDPINDRCEGRYTCNGGCDLYAWGFNVHG